MVLCKQITRMNFHQVSVASIDKIKKKQEVDGAGIVTDGLLVLD